MGQGPAVVATSSSDQSGRIARTVAFLSQKTCRDLPLYDSFMTVWLCSCGMCPDCTLDASCRHDATGIRHLTEANVFLFLLHIAGAAALLIWSVRLVRTGVERAFSIELRLWLRRSADNRILAACTGLVVAVMLQSSTAVAILVSNFASGGTIALSLGLAILLGADVGSALVAQFLLVRFEFIIPVLLLAGTGLFLQGRNKRSRQTGRILIGLGLIFVSLDMIRVTTAPLVDSEAAIRVMQYLGQDRLTSFLIGAAFAWMVHSSVAAVLLFVTLVLQGLLPTNAAVAMVLGANLGGALIAYYLTLNAPLEARRMIVSNLVLRGGGAMLVLLLIALFAPPLDLLGSTGARQVINLHLAFNLGLALLILPVTGLVARLAEKLMQPTPVAAAALGTLTALDPAALATPERALSCAAREILRMGEMVEAMLRSTIRLYANWDDDAASAITGNQTAVRKMHFNIKLYLAGLNRGELTEQSRRKSMELATLAAHLEAAGEFLEGNMMGLARRLDTDGLAFSTTGWREICDLHDRVLANVQLALNIMMTQNPDDARELVAEKDHIRAIEQKLQRNHLDRLREGLKESIETTNIHQETLRALKQINASFSMVAYPILSETGDLLSSRLTEARRQSG